MQPNQTCNGDHTWGRCDRDDCDFVSRTYRYDAADNRIHVYDGGIPVHDEEEGEPSFESLIQDEISREHEREGRNVR